MGVISAHNNTQYVDSKFLLARIRRELSTFDQMGVLDPNDFYEYVMDVLKDGQLGLAGYMECSTIVNIKDGKGKLPENFKYIYSAQLAKCTTHPISHPRLQNGYVFYTDSLYERVGDKTCNVSCTPNNTGCKVTVREYVHGIEDIDNYNYDFVAFMRVSTDCSGYCSGNTQTSSNRNAINTISIENGYLFTNFGEGDIYLKYYGLPIDVDSGLPLIPDNEVVQKAIRYYVIYQYFLTWYWNDIVPNGVAQKAAEAKKLYTESMGQAIHESKLPHFSTLIDAIRLQRKNLNIYQQIDNS